MSLCEFLRLDDFTAYFAHLCLLSGVGRGSEAQFLPDEPEFGQEQHWPCRGSGLVFGEDGEDPEESIMRGEVRQYGSRQSYIIVGEMVN